MAPTKVLLMTNSEHGQANIFLALTYELLHRQNVDVHLCSYAPLEVRFKELLDMHEHAFPHGYRTRAHFHTIRGPSMIEVSARGGSGGPMPHEPTVAGNIAFFKALDGDVWGWTKEEFLDGYATGTRIIKTIKPDITVIDQYFIQARDAAVNAGIKYCLIETMSLSRVVGHLQKHQAWLWKYPAPGTAYGYPVPFFNIGQNIYLQLRLIYAYVTSKQRRKVLGWREEAGIKGPFAWEDEWKVDRLTLTPSLPLLDWPMDITSNVIGCGPITLPTDLRPVAGGQLCQWIGRGPTILINLGSLYAIKAAQAEKIALAVESFLEETTVNGIQILWKLGNYRSESQKLLDVGHAILKDYCDSNRVKIVSWLDVDPVVLLSTGNIACTVHHGGANSWFEGLRYAVPQVLLPAWFDCYDDAKRTEYIGIGIWGNKSSAPDISNVELTSSLHAIFNNEQFRAKALEVAGKLSQVEGRTLAADHILKLAEPESFVWGRMPSEEPEVEHIQNSSGKYLSRVKPGKTNTGWINRAFQTVCIAVHVLFHIWAPLLGVFLLCLPFNLKIVQVLYVGVFGQSFSISAGSWSVLTATWAVFVAYALQQMCTKSPAEENDTPRRYRLLQKTPIWEAYCKARATYFPINLWTSCAIPPTRPYIIGYHPHGALAIGLSVLGHDKLLPGTKLYFMVHAVAFKVQIMADVAQMLNAKSVSSAGVRAQLTTGGNDGKGAGNLVAISIGGGREAGLARPHSMDLVVKCRKGFVKQAIETGASIIPMISFGENELMDLVTDDSGWIAWGIKKIFTVLYKTENQKDIKLYQGIGGLPFIAPYRKPINLVLGQPIHVEKQAKPSADYVTDVHERYMRELEQLWDDWRDTFGIQPSVEFKIVE